MSVIHLRIATITMCLPVDIHQHEKKWIPQRGVHRRNKSKIPRYSYLLDMRLRFA